MVTWNVCAVAYPPVEPVRGFMAGWQQRGVMRILSFLFAPPQYFCIEGVFYFIENQLVMIIGKII